MRKVLASVALAAALAAPGFAYADEAEAGDLKLSIGADFVSSYVFRGYEQQDSGYIVQPFAQVAVVAYSSDQLTITPYIGNWASIHERGEPGDGHFYEDDIYAGIDFEFNYFTLGLIYTWYTSPDDAFEDIKEIGIKLSYDDSREAEGLGLPFQLNPYIGWYFETSDKGGPQDQYVEIGISPSFEIANTPLTVSFPIALGLSPDGFYLDSSGSNEPVGYASFGAFVTYSIPVSYGDWSIYGGVRYYLLNADSVQTAAGEDRDDEFSATVGILFEM